MAVITRRFTVAQEGIGKPDYSRDVSAGKVRAGLTLKYGEALKIFLLAFIDGWATSPFDYAVAPLAPGGTQAYIDAETGLEMPYAIPEGYTLQITALIAKPSQDISVLIYYEGYCAGTLLQLIGGHSHYDNEIVPLSTALLDPTGATHPFEFRLKNEGGGNLYGGATVYCLLHPVGTNPLPTTKTVRCKFCGHEETVPVETTRWICPNCGQLNMYYTLSRFRGTA